MAAKSVNVWRQLLRQWTHTIICFRREQVAGLVSFKAGWLAGRKDRKGGGIRGEWKKNEGRKEGNKKDADRTLVSTAAASPAAICVSSTGVEAEKTREKVRTHKKVWQYNTLPFTSGFITSNLTIHLRPSVYLSSPVFPHSTVICLHNHQHPFTQQATTATTTHNTPTCTHTTPFLGLGKTDRK